MKKDTGKILIKLLWLLPIPAIMVIVNIAADPANLFDGGVYEKELAKLLASGKNVENVSNYNERIFQVYYADEIEKVPQVLVIGSSRSMQISSDCFPGKSLFNASVSNAVIEDYLSITEVYRGRDLMPSTIVLGLDPVIMNRNNNITRWRELENYYFSALGNMTDVNPNIADRTLIPQKYLMLLTPNYFQRSLRVLTNPVENERELIATDQKSGDDAIKLSDGSLVYDRASREKSADDIRADALGNIDDYRLSKYNKLDPSYMKILESYVNWLRKNGIEVVFFLPPYHPAVYEIMVQADQYPVIADAERYFKELADDKNIEIVGSYDPERVGLNDGDFYDHKHPKRDAVLKLFSE